MKNNKSLSGFSIAGYFLFLLPIAFIVGFAILIYSKLQVANLEYWVVVLFIVIYVLCSTLLITLMDVLRRKLMIDEPVKQILDATQKIASGDFNVNLVPLHDYNKYDQYDAIMENINKMAKELSKTEILKTEFISNVSHEIKTPISVIQNYATALKQQDLGEETKQKYLKTIVSTSQKMANLVSNMLRLNKLENQTIIAEEQNVNIGEVLRENILQYEELIDSKKINLVCDIDDIYLTTDSSLLEIIFNNLISNAIKFTNLNGEINITLKNINNNVVVSVKDNGIGMSSSVGSHIFEKFYQGDTSHSSQGNGLGLALVKKVIDILGGEITVESQQNVGSIFTVILKGK